ncbi:polymerase/histidinol phosphatase-like protein [Mucidula mucida]|nr:polymerase/histidinol phosphatase-like protein [Mucidula mucida]
MPFSHHSHSGQFCKHASGTLEEVVLEAIQQNFQVFGLTEHVPRYRIEDLYPEEEGLTSTDLENQFNAFLAEANRLKQKYAPQIDLLVGLETEFISDLDLQRLHDFLGDVEYVVGSIHHVNSIPIDFDLATFQKALRYGTQIDTPENEAHEAFLCSYFNAQYELIREVKPEVIGHFDLCRLYTPSLQFSDFPAVQKLVERNIAEAVRYGALFEVNAAAFRKKWDTAYPGRDVVDLIMKHGGRFTLSDDSHGPHMVGQNYDRAAAYLKSVNVSELWFLQTAQEPNAAGRKIHSVRLDGCWWEHRFWDQRSK